MSNYGNVLYANKHYEVRLIDDAMSENGQGTCDGYGIFNLATGVREATGLVLPETQWRADQFSGMTVELEARAETADDDLAALVEGADEDVTIN